MKAFVIPSIWTAIDKLSGPIKTMGSNVQAFASKTEATVSKAERVFRKITPAFSEMQKQLLAVASAAVIAGAIIGGIKFGFESLTKYEDALASFRTIVSDLADKDFKKFEDKIASVANKTDASTIQVAQSFEKIAGLNADFAKTAKGLGQVSEAAIILSKASKDELGSSAENLVGIMNQFSLKADQASRTINVLAAGQAVGASNIKQTAEAFTNFGSVASGANITLEQSVALVQTLGKQSLFGADAGTKLKSVIVKLQAAGMGYKSGLFNINDALEETNKKMSNIKGAKAQDAFLKKLFDDQINAGSILLKNVDTFEKFTKGVTGTSEATKAAAINSATLTAMVEKLKNKFINWITTSDDAKQLLEKLKQLLGFVAKNFSTIVKVVGYGIGIFTGFWAILKVVRIALFAYNVIVGICAVTSSSLAVGVGAGNVAIRAQAIATRAVIVAQWLWNAAMAANPIFLLVAGVAALGLAVYGLVKYFSQASAAEKVASEVRERALEKTIDQRVEITLLFNALRKATQGSAEYNSTLEKINQIQPGLIDKYNLQAKSIRNINAAEQELISSIMQRAEAEARAELLREKTKQMIQNQTTPVGGWESFLSGGEQQAKLIRQAENIQLQEQINILANDLANPKEAINTKKSAQEGVINTMNVAQQIGNLNINIKGDTDKADITTDADFVKVNTSSTMKTN